NDRADRHRRARRGGCRPVRAGRGSGAALAQRVGRLRAHRVRRRLAERGAPRGRRDDVRQLRGGCRARRRGRAARRGPRRHSEPALRRVGRLRRLLQLPRVDRAAGARSRVTERSEPVGAALLEAVAVMDRLRSPGGCPWDAEQTHASLAPYAIEEAHEVAEAAESGSPEGLREELGDLLLQVLFHARIAAEHPDGFDIDDVARALVDKLTYRHPHVFADDGGASPSAAQVTENWEVLKAAEQQRDSALDGIPVSLPALARAQK